MFLQNLEIIFLLLTYTESNTFGGGGEKKNGKKNLCILTENTACNGVFPIWLSFINGTKRKYLRVRQYALPESFMVIFRIFGIPCHILIFAFVLQVKQSAVTFAYWKRFPFMHQQHKYGNRILFLRNLCVKCLTAEIDQF